MNIAKALKEAREAAGLTLKQLEDRSGRTVQYLERIENGEVSYGDINKGDLHAISSAFGITPEVLFMLGMEDKDIAPGKKQIADTLMPSIRGLVLELIKHKDQ